MENSGPAFRVADGPRRVDARGVKADRWNAASSVAKRTLNIPTNRSGRGLFGLFRRTSGRVALTLTSKAPSKGLFSADMPDAAMGVEFAKTEGLEVSSAC